VTVLTLQLVSPTLPPGKKITFNLQDQTALASLRKDPIVIKEGVEYKYVSG
jgi:Rho GDP-dissociation inhibitor